VREGKRRIIVLNGLASETERKKEGPRVMRAAFLDFTSSTLVNKGAEVAVADVWMGEQKNVPLIATESYATGLHMDALPKIKGTVVYKSPLMAPVKEGDIVGDLIVSAPGTPDKKIPVAAGKAVNELGLFGKAMAGLRGPDDEEEEAEGKKE
jgi:D-alanyl-D-alanine carboxypeptidase (penicillin-binding protein 5/6)